MNRATGASLATLGLLSTLYFSQGLPFGFFTQALPVMLRNEGFTLAQIGFSSLLALPWALKFAWAPLVDRFWSPALGPRRSWILPLQGLAVATLVAIAFTEIASSMKALMAVVFVLNLLAATQDIATDGWAVDRVRPEARGMANGVQVAGYRVGMVLGGGALLMLYERIGTRATFLGMAAMLALATVPALLAREGQRTERPRKEAPRVRHFVRRTGAVQLLALVIAYKAGDALATAMLRPYLADLGYTLAQIGWLLGTVGFTAGLAGALVGGALVRPLGRRTALIVFGVLQALSIAGYAIAATTTPSQTSIAVLCAFEHFAGGTATAALFTCMMDWCAPRASATDYTVQASAVVVATGVASAVSGVLAGAVGYGPHFIVSAALASLTVAVAAVLFPTPDLVARFMRDADPHGLDR